MLRSPGWPLAFVVALTWAVVPLLPALLARAIPGQPYTDLYPSIWGLDVFCASLPAIVTHTARMGAPEGIGFYYSSPLHGLAGWPVWATFGPVAAYVATLIAARAATVLCAFGFLRALNHAPLAALGGALLYGASPFFHGYAVEGIVEGTDGWALALWAWMVVRNRPVAAISAFALTILSSWYLGMVACLLAVVLGARYRTAWISILGLLLATPALWAFTHAFGGNTPLDPVVRVAMGAPLWFPVPGLTPGLNPFALTTYVGFAAVALAFPSARRRPLWALGAVACAILSTGRGPWWDLPVLEMVRFPYRWHAGTLLCLAPLVAETAARRKRPLLAALPFLEGLLLSPIEPVVPSAPADLPAIYATVAADTLLEIPGPVAMTPGKPNASRPRARWFLYAQLSHHASSPWTLDFNGIAGGRNAPWLAAFASWDPLLHAPNQPLDLDAARTAGVDEVLVHRDLLERDADAFEAALVAAGATLIAREGDLALYRL
ncbi:hypothetical protein LBMAG42_34450 [Deltaproteobacteria bacterium]|nr:hypothetical protein LBMAG42_34450 [Deltaproteobacteria bacterium]